jgi:hypothetical protein
MTMLTTLTRALRALMRRGGLVDSEFPPTTVGISDWHENLPSGPAQFDDAEPEGACTNCPHRDECAERHACQRRAGA